MTGAQVAARRGSWLSGLPIRRENHAYAAIFLAPTVLLVLALIVYPLGYSLLLTLTRTSGGQRTWAGLDSWARLANDPLFTQSLVQTVMYVVPGRAPRPAPAVAGPAGAGRDSAVVLLGRAGDPLHAGRHPRLEDVPAHGAHLPGEPAVPAAGDGARRADRRGECLAALPLRHLAVRAADDRRRADHPAARHDPALRPDLRADRRRAGGVLHLQPVLLRVQDQLRAHQLELRSGTGVRGHRHRHRLRAAADARRPVPEAVMTVAEAAWTDAADARARLTAWAGAALVIGAAALGLSQLIVDWPFPFWAWLLATIIGLVLMWRGLNALHIGMGARAVAATLAFLVVLLIAVPFAVVVVFGSLQRPVDLLTGPHAIPPQPTLDQYARLFTIAYWSE